MALTPAQQAALATLSPYQQKVVNAALPLASGQRSDAQLAAMQVFQAAQKGAPATGSVPMTVSGGPVQMTVSGGGSSGGGGGGGGQSLPPPGGANAWNGYSAAQKAAFLKQSGGLDPVQYASLMGLSLGSKPWWQGGTQGMTVTPGYMPANYTPQTDAGALYMINLRTGSNYATLEEAKAAEQLKYQLAGVNQYVGNQEANVGGGGSPARGHPELQNVSMQGFSDMPSWLRYINSLTGGTTAGQTAVSQARAEMVPEWLPGVQAEAMAGGMPYLPLELFGSPGMDINRDPSEPLYGAGVNPASMIGLTGGQAGENAFYRSLSAEELLREIAPLYWSYYHRGAGEPVPAGMEAGMMFGSPIYNAGPNTSQGASTGTYTESPIKGMTGRPQQIGAGTLAAEGLQGETDPYELGRQLAGGLYNRWSAYGYPGTGSQSTVGGPLFDPSTGQTDQYRIDPFSGGYGADPYFADFWAEPNFQPWQSLDPETLQRLMALMGDPSYSGTPMGEAY
jgi:hypothetical protein